MSLRGFHVVFIAASALLALFVAAWCLGVLPGGPGEIHVVAGVASLLACASLVVYETWFLRKTRGLQ